MLSHEIPPTHITSDTLFSTIMHVCRYNPSERIKPSDALRHPFFNSIFSPLCKLPSGLPIDQTVLGLPLLAEEMLLIGGRQGLVEDGGSIPTGIAAPGNNNATGFTVTATTVRVSGMTTSNLGGGGGGGAKEHVDGGDLQAKESSMQLC